MAVFSDGMKNEYFIMNNTSIGVASRFTTKAEILVVVNASIAVIAEKI